MNDAGFMRGGDSGGGLQHQRDCTRGFDWRLATQDLSQRTPFEQLHHDVNAAFSSLSEVSHRHRVWMTQLYGRACLSLKTNARRFVFYQALMQKLDRDRTVHRQVSRAVHGAHAASAETFFDTVLLVERAAYKRVRNRQCGWTICHLMK